MFNVQMTPCLGVLVTPILEFFTRGGVGIPEPFVTLTSALLPIFPAYSLLTYYLSHLSLYVILVFSVSTAAAVYSVMQGIGL